MSEQAAATGIAFHSASEAWNLAGLKAALIVATDPGQRRLTDTLPHEIAGGWGTWGAGGHRRLPAR